METFKNKLSKIQAKLGSARLVLVSKTRSVEDIKSYYQLGQRDFGENRVAELSEKAELLKVECPAIRWHMIGNLQTNKVRELLKVPHLFAIHSIDRFSLLEKLLNHPPLLPTHIRLFLQVNVSQEEEKSGFSTYEEILNASRMILSSDCFTLSGLMGMATLRTEEKEKEARRCFQELYFLKEKLQSELHLPLQTSMGMSQDYEIALEEHSDWVRLGSMMFEE